MNKYCIRFRIIGRGNELHIWERFAPNDESALSSANNALKHEYPNGYELVSVLSA
jgi:hypothetical protein